MSVVPVQLCLAGREVTDVRVRPGGQWVSGVVSEPGLHGTVSRLCMWSVAHRDVVVDVLVDPMPMTGRGLSGGVHCWDLEGRRVFVSTAKEGIVEVALVDDVPEHQNLLAFDPTRNWTTPAIDYTQSSVYAIADWCEMWKCTLDGGEPQLVYRTDGFAIDATAGADGMCLTWDRPHMPWTQSTIYPEPALSEVAMQQPRFSTQGNSFGYIDDTTGVANVRLLADRVVAHDVVIDDDCEHGGPTWGPGQRTWCFNTEGTKVAYTRNEKGFGTLWVYDRLTTQRTKVDKGIFGCVSWENDTLAALRTGARTPTQVVTYDMSPQKFGERTVVVQPGVEQWLAPEIEQELVEPSLHEASHGDVVVPYRLYRAKTPNWGIIVWVHGGPVDQWQVTFRPKFSYWLSRGWSIAVVDHRGTTGHGRSFQQQLDGHWGDYDARDTVAVVRQVQRAFGFRSERTVLMGSSAGGLSVLNALGTSRTLAAGAVVSFPVVDLAELMQGTDPFETHYMPRLIGAGDVGDPLLMERSPLSRAHVIAGTPLLVFHGDKDTLVPLSHSEQLRDVVNAAGGAVRLEVMQGEGHGFRDPLHIIREYSMTEEFLHELMG
jgi:dipeptidyl aminopeptidase/acylaminoacyl peptidase